MSANRRELTARERALGMGREITRRDFLNAGLLAGGSLLLWKPAPAQLLPQVSDWDGYGGIGDYSRAHGNTREVLEAAHSIAVGEHDSAPDDAIQTGETFDLVVVGGGMAGLSAAYSLRKHKPGATCLILDNHRIFGGESKRNEFSVDGQLLIGPQGANEFDIPAQPEDEGYELFADLGIPRQFNYQQLTGTKRSLEFDRTNYGFQMWVDESPSFGHFFRQSESKGSWTRNLWEKKLSGSAYSEAVRQDFLKWKYGDQRPEPQGDFEVWLDQMTYKHYLEEILQLDPEVTRYADPIMAAAIGSGCDAVSAYGAYSISMPGFRGVSKELYYPHRLADVSPQTWHAFPGGNTGFTRYFIKNLIPDAIEGESDLNSVINGRVRFSTLDRADQQTRLRLGATATRVEHSGTPEKANEVLITYLLDNQLFQVKARSVVMASGGWVNRHIVRDLPSEYRAAYDTFRHAPVLVVNVALRNWKFLEHLGLTACRWFDGFGFSCNIRRPMVVGNYQPPLDPGKPTILTFYIPFYYPGLSAQVQGTRGRMELLNTSFREYEKQLRQQMVELFQDSGFDPEHDIAGIVLNRWGHAYVVPQPGFFFGQDNHPAPRDVIRNRFGRISFGHSELVGHQYWLGAIREADRACQQILEFL